MTISLKKNKKNCTIALPEDLSAVLAAPLKTTLCEAISYQQPISIDIACVIYCHSLCLQLLLAVEKAAEAAQLAITYKGQSTAMTEAARTLGLNMKLTTQP